MKNQSQYNKMINTPIPILIIKLSIPTIVSMMITNVYNLVDTAFVGTLGNSASGAIGVVFGFMSILQAIGFLFGQGGGSILSRMLGNKDDENANIIASTSFFLSFGFSSILAIVCFIFIDQLVMILGSSVTIAPYAKTYIFFILLTSPFQVSSFTLNNILRYEGKASLGMIGLLVGAILNIGGDIVFMFVFKMGIAGAGLSTALSQVISFCVLISSFILKKTQCVISLKKVTFAWKTFWNIFMTGSPSLARQVLGSVATILLNMESKQYGDEAVAAMSIVSRIFFFIFAVTLGVGQGFQPISAFNYGAKKYKRVRKAYFYTVIYSEILIFVLSFITFVNAEFFIRLFRDDDSVVYIAERALKLHCIGGLFIPFGMTTDMLYQSTGHKIGALILSSMRSGLLFIPILIIMTLIRGLNGIQEAQPSAYLVSVIPTIIFAVHFLKKMPAEDN